MINLPGIKPPVLFQNEIVFLVSKNHLKNFYPLCKNTKNLKKKGKKPQGQWKNWGL